MFTDLVLSPFGADPRSMVEAAVAADAGFDGVYTYDHFSGLVAGQPWSRDPFVVLGAIAAATETVRVGVLVANVFNRHPVQLATAVNSLQALAAGGVMCGIGSGARAGTPFAAEYELVERPVAGADERRHRLLSTIGALRDLWADGTMAVVDGLPTPPIVVGGSSRAAAELAGANADGVNLRRRADDVLARQVAAARAAAGDRPFEVSVFDAFDPDHLLGGDPGPLETIGADRRTLWVAPPYPVAAIGAVARRLSSRR